MPVDAPTRQDARPRTRRLFEDHNLHLANCQAALWRLRRCAELLSVTNREAASIIVGCAAVLDMELQGKIPGRRRELDA